MTFDFMLLASSFITFFVAIDAIGVAPIFASLTAGSSAAHKRNMAIKSTVIASGILLGFAYLGAFLLEAMHISLDAFRAAGGVLLFMIALDMVFEKRTERREERAEKLQEDEAEHPGAHEDISVFPLAIPMLAGPGSIASIMLFMSQAGSDIGKQVMVLGGVGANLLLAMLIFLAVGPVMKIIGETMAAMITRILGVILAALAAQFIFDAIIGAFGLNVGH